MEDIVDIPFVDDQDETPLRTIYSCGSLCKDDVRDYDDDVYLVHLSP